MLDGLELFCCCELFLGVADACSKREAKAPPEQMAAQTARVVRMAREEKRGVRLTFQRRRINEIDFIEGPTAGKRASALTDMELKRLALTMPHRTARFAIRRYLRHRKDGVLAPAREPVIRR